MPDGVLHGDKLARAIESEVGASSGGRALIKEHSSLQTVSHFADIEWTRFGCLSPPLREIAKVNEYEVCVTPDMQVTFSARLTFQGVAPRHLAQLVALPPRSRQGRMEPNSPLCGGVFPATNSYVFEPAFKNRRIAFLCFVCRCSNFIRHIPPCLFIVRWAGCPSFYLLHFAAFRCTFSSCVCCDSPGFSDSGWRLLCSPALFVE